MKELSIKEKAKRYDEAIKRVEDIKTGKCETRFMFTEGLFEFIFPALKESEDERIIGNIIATIHLYYGEPLEDEAKEMIAWLEKQADTQKKIDYAYAKGLADAQKALKKQGEQKSTEEYNITGIGSKNAKGKLGEMIKNLKPVNEVLEQKSAELSEEIPTDLKDIVDKEANAIWEEESSDGCHLVIDSFNMFFGICMQIAEAVVDYRKPAWSEEDEAVLDALIRRFKGEDIYVSPNSAVECLECIKDRVGKFDDGYKVGFSAAKHNQWKPSDEQIRELSIVSTGRGLFNKDILSELLEQLKKLRKE